MDPEDKFYLFDAAATIYHLFTFFWNRNQIYHVASAPTVTGSRVLYAEILIIFGTVCTVYCMM